MEKIIQNYLLSEPEELLMVVISAVVIYLAVILFTRIFGLRSFSKMSSFDFAMTVAIGSLIASVTISTTSLMNGVVGLLVIYTLQLSVAFLRRKKFVEKAVDNRPMLLMRNGEILEENMREVRVTKDDLRSKLREANVFNYNQVRAVVMETTGDISVLHSSDENEVLDGDLLQDVRGFG